MSCSIGISTQCLARVALAMLFGLIGHTAMAQSSTSPGLEGTSWQLVKFQGSDEKVLTPDDRANTRSNSLPPVSSPHGSTAIADAALGNRAGQISSSSVH